MSNSRSAKSLNSLAQLASIKADLKLENTPDNVTVPTTQKEKIKQRLATILAKPAEPENKDFDDNVSEHQLFLDAVRGAKPFEQATIPADLMTSPKKKTADWAQLAKRASATQTIASASQSVALSSHQEFFTPMSPDTILSYKDKTLQNRVFEQLKKGELRWYLAVDLHGCTVEESREAVLELIQTAQTDGHTIIKISHGKGEQGIIKTSVNGWLRQHPQVLAFHSAPDKQGGTGAVLVLIKRAMS